MRGKRFNKRRLIEILIMIPITILVFTIPTKLIYGTLQNEKELEERYRKNKNISDSLKETADIIIQEGKGIDIAKISNEKVKYKIYNENEKIILYYYLKEDSMGSPRYNAKIMLSNNYEILQEEYSFEVESYEEYIKKWTVLYKILSFIAGLMIVIILNYIILGLKFIKNIKIKLK